MIQIIFSHRPPLYDLFDKAELRALHTPCSGAAATYSIAQAKGIAEDLVVQGEQYKAAVHKPEGSVGQFMPQNDFSVQVEVPLGEGMPPYLSNVLVNPEAIHFEDNAFFHLICHIEPNIKSKIQKGGFC